MAIKRPDDMKDEHWQFVCLLPQNNWNRTKTYKQIYGDMDDSVAAASASRLLRNVKVRDALKNAYADAAMGLEEMFAEIATIARNEAEETRSRLRALELVGKGHAAFTDKIKQDSELTINIQYGDGK